MTIIEVMYGAIVFLIATGSAWYACVTAFKNTSEFIGSLMALVFVVWPMFIYSKPVFILILQWVLGFIS